MAKSSAIAAIMRRMTSGSRLTSARAPRGIVTALAIVTLGFTGVLNWTALSQGLFLLPFAVVGAITGARLFGHASEAAYRRGALAIIVVAALAALVY